MPGSADFIAAVLALPNLDNLWECQEASGLPIDASPNGFDATSITGTVTYEVPGPDGGTDFAISLNPGTIERSAPMNTNTVDTAFGIWVRWIANSVNQAFVENGNPGANGYGALLVGSAAIRGIAHGIGFKGGTTDNLSDGLWHFLGFQITAGGSWEVYFNGVADPSSPIGSGAITAPTTKFIIARDGAQVEVAYEFSVSQALSAPTWAALYAAMVGGAPVNTVPPVLSGAAAVGSTLTTDDGTWTDADTFTYQWEISADGMSGWTPIGGETANTYLVDSGDLTEFLRCVVTAHNGDGDTDEPSNVLGPVIPVGSGPVIIAFDTGDSVDSFASTTWTPDTSGVLAGDYMIACVEAAFTAAQGVTAPEGWELLDTGVGPANTLSNTYGKLTYEDTPTEVFTFASGANYCATLIAVRGGFDPGEPFGDYIKTTNNTLGNVSYDDQDLVLGITLGFDSGAPAGINAIPAGFTDVIEEANATLFAVGWVIDDTKLEATGSGNTSGLSFTYQTGTDVYTLTILIPFNPGDVPEILTSPVATGSAEVLGTVFTTNGTWTFTPLSYTYQWQSSADGLTGWANIGGATASSYTIDNAYSGLFLRARVTAHNADGASVPAPSNVLGPVSPFPAVRYFSVTA